MTTETQIPDPPETEFETLVCLGQSRVRALAESVGVCCLTRFVYGLAERLQRQGLIREDLDGLTDEEREEQHVILAYAIGATPEAKWQATLAELRTLH